MLSDPTRGEQGEETNNGGGITPAVVAWIVSQAQISSLIVEPSVMCCGRPVGSLTVVVSGLSPRAA